MTVRWLEPTRALAALFGLQWLLWWLLMPPTPTIPGAAPRHTPEIAVLRYAVLAAALLAGVIAGRLIVGDRPAAGAAVLPGRYWRRVSLVALGLAVIGTAIYARDLLADPGAIVRALLLGEFASLTETVRTSRITGLSSLSNLLTVPVAIYGLTAAHPDASRVVRRNAGIALAVAFGVVVVHALLLMGRMTLINAAGVLAGAVLVARHGRMLPRRAALRLSVAALVLLAVIWLGETARSGVTQALTTGETAFSVSTQRFVRDRLVQGYFAADLNNALVLLDCPPAMQLAGTTPLAAPLGATTPYPARCPAWTSRFGTVNVLALWWWDLGWLALAAAALAGAWLGGSYQAATRPGAGIAPMLIFLVSLPAYYALLRTNWLASTAFLVPLGFVAAANLLRAGVPAAVATAEA